MFDVIDFLESAGQDAQWRQAETEVRAAAMADAQITPALRAVLLAGDAQELQRLLGQPVFCCLINPAKPGEEQEECDGSCEEGDDEDKEANEDADKDRRSGTGNGDD